MTYHVLIPDNVDQAAVDLLEGTDGIEVTAGSLSREQTLAALPQADAMIIRSSTKADADLLAHADRLKVIARAGVGVDNVDLDAATERGIVVMNTPGGNTIATAEMTLGLMLALARHIPQGDQSLKAGRWDRKQYMGTELRGKTLGLFGFGRIGQAVAARAQAFEMTVIAHDPYIPPEVAEQRNVRLVDFDTLLGEADFISLHSVLTDETREMIDAAAIAKMKPGVRIVNAARGGLINEADLAEGIRSGKVAGAALDVYGTEPPPADHPLVGLEGVIDTPHLAASTYEAQVAVAVEAAELVRDALLNGQYDNVVNPAVLKTT